MGISKFSYDMDIISRLSDAPNVDDGLTASQLKAKFDEGGKAVKEYINNTLTEEIDAKTVGTDNISDGAVTPEKLSEAYVPAGGGTFSGDVTFSKNINADGVVAPSNIFSVNSHLLAGQQIFLTESCYGTTLPSGEHHQGRIFFKKV